MHHHQTEVSITQDGMAAQRRAVSRSRGAKKQRPSAEAETSPPAGDSTLALLCRVLELGAASVWRYLTFEEVSCIIRAVRCALSKELIDSMALKAVGEFAAEYKTHLGGGCKCDWMRNLHFITGLEARNKCHDTPPFNANKDTPVLQTPVSWANRFANPAYYPVVCPLLSGGVQSLRTKAAVTRAMNAVYLGSGSHFFYKVTKTTGSARSPDFLFEHWDGITGTSCQYCDDLPNESTKEIGRWTPKEIESIRANCKELYRPLKEQMQQNLRFVRCVRRPRRSVGRVFAPYKGLVAGITCDGVLCGLYLNIGYWGDE